jgi:hypothetical protein
MAKYSDAIRWKKTTQGFSDALGYAGEHLTGWARMWMDEAVTQALSEIDADWEGETHWKRESGKISSFGGDRFHPWYTGQLHDSVAGIVSDQHKVVSIRYMQPSATKPQTYQGQIIRGRELAEEAAQRVAKALRFVPGVKATITVGVPYAEKVDNMPRHEGFIRYLNDQFTSKVEDYFYIRAEGYRTRFLVADKNK